MKQGIVATKIASHAGDIAKGIKGAREWDNAMSKARAELDWATMFELALDPEKPRKYRDSSKPEHEDSCTMCGNMCALRTVNNIFYGEVVDLVFD